MSGPLSDQPACAAECVPQGAIDAAIRAAAEGMHDDGHTDCYYAGILLAAWPHLSLADSQAEVSRLREMIGALEPGDVCLAPPDLAGEDRGHGT